MKRDTMTRVAGAALMAGVAVTHLLEARDEEARYMVVLFGCLSVASIVVGGLLLLGRFRSVWPVAGVLCATAITGYLLSRTVGLPQMADDVSNWAEPLGLIALACELAVV